MSNDRDTLERMLDDLEETAWKTDIDQVMDEESPGPTQYSCVIDSNGNWI